MKIKTFTTAALLIFLLVSATIIYFGIYKTPSQTQKFEENLTPVKKEEPNLTITPIVEKNNTSVPQTQTYTPAPRPPVRTSAS